MPDPEGRAAETSAPVTLSGEIIAFDGDVVRVRLETGEIGMISRPELSDAQGSLRPGTRARFRVERPDPQGSPHLGWVPAAGDDSTVRPSFEREVDRLQHVLANRHPTNKRQHTLSDPLGEEKVEQWVRRTEESLSRLRKHRAKRLNEEFYSG